MELKALFVLTVYVIVLSVFNLGEFVFVGGGEHVIETEGAVKQDGLYKGNLKGT